MNQTGYLNLEKPDSGDAVDVTVINANADKIDHFARITSIGIAALNDTYPNQLLLATDAQNPTYGTPAACDGILVRAECGENVDIGLRIFAGESGAIYMSARRNENEWYDWAEIVKPSE